MYRAGLLAALVVAAPANAATLPAANVPGVQVGHDPSGAYRLTFTAAAYRPLAGRRIVITCSSAAPRSPAAAPPRRFDSRFDVPRTRGPILLRSARDADVCALSATTTILVGLDRRGR